MKERNILESIVYAYLITTGYLPDDAERAVAKMSDDELDNFLE